MKLSLLICLAALAIPSCLSDFEFGRSPLLEEDLDLEHLIALHHGDMSMPSMSMSFSYSYDDYTPTCLDMAQTVYHTLIPLETSKDSVSFSAIEHIIIEAIHQLFPFCDHIHPTGQRKLQSAKSAFYFESVKLTDGKSTCTPTLAGNNCFLGDLQLTFYGAPTDADVKEIMDRIGGLLANASGLLANASGLLANANERGAALGPVSTTSPTDDASQGTNKLSANVSTTSTNHHMSAGEKLLISLLVIGIAALVAFIASGYRCMNQYRGKHGPSSGDDLEKSESSSEDTVAVTAVPYGDN